MAEARNPEMYKPETWSHIVCKGLHRSVCVCVCGGVVGGVLGLRGRGYKTYWWVHDVAGVHASCHFGHQWIPCAGRWLEVPC